MNAHMCSGSIGTWAGMNSASGSSSNLGEGSREGVGQPALTVSLLLLYSS